MIKKLSIALVILAAAGLALAEDVRSLRGHVELQDDSRAPEPKQFAKDGEPIARDYVQQPPLIPHKIEAITST